METTPSSADLVRAVNRLLDEVCLSPTRASSLLVARGLPPVICKRIAAERHLLGRYLTHFRQLLYLEVVRATRQANAAALFKLYGLEYGAPESIDDAAAFLGLSAEDLSILVHASLDHLRRIAADGTLSDIAIASALGEWPSTDADLSALDVSLDYPPPPTPRSARILFAPYAHVITELLPRDSGAPLALGSRHSSPTQLSIGSYDYSTTDLDGLDSDHFMLF